jgi:hypothetical protein
MRLLLWRHGECVTKFYVGEWFQRGNQYAVKVIYQVSQVRFAFLIV